MVRKKLYLTSYDIAENDARNQISEYLSGYGQRVNLSVFECMVTKAQLKLIKAELTQLSDNNSDTILIYLVCRECFTKAERIGKPMSDAEEIVVV